MKEKIDVAKFNNNDDKDSFTMTCPYCDSQLYIYKTEGRNNFLCLSCDNQWALALRKVKNKDPLCMRH